jgi:hypothetical protein
MQPFGRVGYGTSFICVAFALLVTIAMSLRILPDLSSGGLTNPDTYMRLVRLREMLDSGGVVYSVARDGSGHGTVLHWSHLIDSLLCLLMQPFLLVLPPHDALHAAAMIFGPLNVAALGFAVVWAAAPFAERKYLWLGAVLVPLSPAIISYGLAGVVHHHIAIVVVAVACSGWAARLIVGHTRAHAGIALGAWAGVGVWLTPESVPLTMLAFGALWLAWIVRPERDDIAAAIGLTGVAFASVTVLALLVDPPAAGIGAVEIDRVSILFAGFALAIAMVGVGVWVVHRLVPNRGPRVAAACAIGVVCCAIWAVALRDSMFNGNMLVDTAQRDAMFGHIAEMMPIGGALVGLHHLLTGVCATLLLTVLAVGRRSALLGYGAICLAGLLVLGWSHVRFAAYPEAAGAIALPVALTLAERATLTWHQIGQSFTRLATILLFIQMPYLGQFAAVISSARATPAVVPPSCKFADAAHMLASHPGEVVLADVNDTPEILYRTKVRTVGSLYHRDLAGFLRLRAAWGAAPSETVPPEIDAAEVSLVLGCATPARSSLIEEIKRETLFDQVRTGHPPPWLRQIDANPASGQVLYEVVRSDQPRAIDTEISR